MARTVNWVTSGRRLFTLSLFLDHSCLSLSLHLDSSVSPSLSSLLCLSIYLLISLSLSLSLSLNHFPQLFLLIYMSLFVLIPSLPLCLSVSLCFSIFFYFSLSLSLFLFFPLTPRLLFSLSPPYLFLPISLCSRLPCLVTPGSFVILMSASTHCRPDTNSTYLFL